MATLLSVNVGMPKDVLWQGRTVHTGVWKSSVAGPRMVRRLNIDGDGQGDLRGHGGENRAVLVYQIDSYNYWQRHFGRDDFVHGQFGENLTVDGLPDDEVCVGDRYRIGEAEFEVTQPRVTCYRVGMRLGEPDLPALLVAHHRPGFYLRVITEGHVQAGDEIVRTRTGPERFTVADIDALLYLPDRDPERLRAALRIPALSPGWRSSFEDLLAAAEHGQPAASASAPAIGAEPGWVGFRRLKVVATVVESTTVTSIHLAAADGRPLPAALPGQYVTVRVAAAGEPAPVRSYSLSSAPGDEGYRISVKRERCGVVSGYLHKGLHPGTMLDVAAPRGEFVLGGGDTPVVLLSAGVGVTPVLAMLHQLVAEDSLRAVWWVHVARDPAEHVLGEEAHDLLTRLRDAHEQVFYTATCAGPGAPGYRTPLGVAHRLVAPFRISAGRPGARALSEMGIPPEAGAYVCGPAGFMADMRTVLESLGLRGENIHTELFGGRPAITPGIAERVAPPPHPPTGPPGTGPLVTFARSGLSVPWSQERRGIIDLAEACDIPTRWSCRTGVCHTCVTALQWSSLVRKGDLPGRSPLRPPPR
ncbi:MOSC domain-containing protein [Parafrankia discariae]|uniref:MOSC domain-containing protein n=1 Tax=Parafrankia discariae TaxID=365528 RepID=UPI0003796560|nr:MOSC domain-containing protein [Parafrankia discariae]